MPIAPGRGYVALRRGRHSIAGAEYFLTCCTAERQPGLESHDIASRIMAIAHGLSHDGIWVLRTAVIMRDHVHLLVALNDREPLSGALRLFKGRTSPILRNAKLSWQRGYFDHRMREAEDLLPVFLYVFLNPHRAGLVRANEHWPGYFCAAEDWAWFSPLTDHECPFPEWIV